MSKLPFDLWQQGLLYVPYLNAVCFKIYGDIFPLQFTLLTLKVSLNYLTTVVMKTFQWPFSLFHWFKKNSCQLLKKEHVLSKGKLPRRLAQEQCVYVNWPRPKWPKMCWRALKQKSNQNLTTVHLCRLMWRICQSDSLKYISLSNSRPMFNGSVWWIISRRIG